MSKPEPLVNLTPITDLTPITNLMHINVSIDIPAIQALANAIRYHVDSQQGTRVHLAPAPLTKLGAEGQRAIPVDNPDPEGQPGIPNTEGQVAADAAPTKRTRRTKAQMDEARKIEEVTGRRVDLPAPIESVSALVDEANPEPFVWTLQLLKDTFITPLSGKPDFQNEIAAIRKEVAPEATKLVTTAPEHYPELAKRFTEWYQAKGLDLQLPGGAE